MKLKFDLDHIECCDIKGDDIVVYFDGGFNISFRKSTYQYYLTIFRLKGDMWWTEKFESGVKSFLEYKCKQNG